MLCDKHVVKMLVETAQLLSTVWHECAAPEDVPALAYRPSHQRHPCAIWARTSSMNYFWLHDHGLAMADEYTLRYAGRRHASRAVIEARRVPPLECVPVGALTPFAQCMPDQYKREGDPVAAYRAYYLGDKSRFATWRGRKTPDWFTLGVSPATMQGPQPNPV
jgi:hypothetical protein